MIEHDAVHTHNSFLIDEWTCGKKVLKNAFLIGINKKFSSNMYPMVDEGYWEWSSYMSHALLTKSGRHWYLLWEYKQKLKRLNNKE